MYVYEDNGTDIFIWQHANHIFATTTSLQHIN